GTGMHGGTIFIRGRVNPEQLGKEVGVAEPDEADQVFLAGVIEDYRRHFGRGRGTARGRDAGRISAEGFVKLYPRFLRPYGRLYAQ
ncbi:MAG: hypothetical protein ACYC6I_08745, partial [Bacillota bacterium]